MNSLATYLARAKDCLQYTMKKGIRVDLCYRVVSFDGIETASVTVRMIRATEFLTVLLALSLKAETVQKLIITMYDTTRMVSYHLSLKSIPNSWTLWNQTEVNGFAMIVQKYCGWSTHTMDSNCDPILPLWNDLRVIDYLIRLFPTQDKCTQRTIE